MTRPNINVTPLIDILLVLLIIFMVVSPLKPSAFKTKIPSENRDMNGDPNPLTLVVTLMPDDGIAINDQKTAATVAEPEPLSAKLKAIFAERTANGVASDSAGRDRERPFSDLTERTVFIKASRSAQYGDVARVIDAVKLGGAYPISLQIDSLDR